MEVYEAIRKRKSTRNYTEEEVKREQIEQVLEAGRQAPFAGLAQAGKTDFRHFFVIKRGSETAEKLMDLVLEARKEDLREVEENIWKKNTLFMPEQSKMVRERNLWIFLWRRF